MILRRTHIIFRSTFPHRIFYNGSETDSLELVERNYRLVLTSMRARLHTAQSVANTRSNGRKQAVKMGVRSQEDIASRISVAFFMRTLWLWPTTQPHFKFRREKLTSCSGCCCFNASLLLDPLVLVVVRKKKASIWNFRISLQPLFQTSIRKYWRIYTWRWNF